MSDQIAAPPAAQTPPVAPAAPAAAPPAAPPVAAPPPDDQAPTWLPDRLKQARATERQQLLSEFGVDDPAKLKDKLKRLDELETATLTEKERTEKQIKELSPKAAQAERLQTLFSSVVESKFATLGDKQREAIDAKAKGDPEKRWELMQFMELAGLPGAVPITPKPAQTAPAAPPAPAPATPQTPFTKWQDMRSSDSVAASVFYQLNAMSIEQSRPKEGA